MAFYEWYFDRIFIKLTAADSRYISRLARQTDNEAQQQVGYQADSLRTLI